MSWWGARSYSLYLWHAPILRVFIVLAAVQAPWIRESYYYAFGLSVVAAVASLYVARLAYWLVERHFTNTKPTSSTRAQPTPDELSKPSAELSFAD
jgi:peptidoglycan/LPS O-acetylase OafA/YrhL